VYLNTELGINRVAVRSTMTAGTITVSAKRDGLKPAQIQIVSKPVVITDGIAAFMPAHLPGPAEKS
jgi:beta-galactosidase